MAPKASPSHPAGEDPLTHFGFRAVETPEKARLVRNVFEAVAGRYDLMNDLMSAGIHRLWKASMMDALAPRAGMHLLDVAGGTGDIALRFHARIKGQGKATICDASPAMIEKGRARALDQGLLPGPSLSWVCGDAQNLPLPAASADAYTIAFGLRNVTDIDAALREAQRVLKPGGRFLCLEFSQVVLPVLDKLYDLYSFNVLPALGALVTGNEDAYRYLVESIRRFPAQDALGEKIEAAGLERASYQNFSGGIAALHSAWRL